MSTDRPDTTATDAVTDPRKDSLIEYPSQFPIKVMGAKVDGFVHAITQIAERFDPAFDATTVPPGGRLAKLTFRGGSTYEPELSRVARSVGVDYSILSGRISRIRGEPYGQLVVAFTGGDAEAAVAQLTARGVTVEQVGEVA